MSLSLLNPERMQSLKDMLMLTHGIPGEVVEVGVYRGGSLLEIGKLVDRYMPSKTVFGFDTFMGIPNADPAVDNHHKNGDFADTTYGEVSRMLQKEGVRSVVLSAAKFPEGYEEMTQIPKVSFAHFDTDTFESTLDCLAWVTPRMPIGGVVVVDDYNSATCKGVTRAVNFFLANEFSFSTFRELPAQIILARDAGVGRRCGSTSK